jgi:hypothetical protein
VYARDSIHSSAAATSSSRQHCTRAAESSDLCHFDEFNWIKNSFENAPGPSSLNVNEQEQLIDLTSDTSLKSTFKELPLSEFWIHIGKESRTLSPKALKILIPFAITYLCETGFSAWAAMTSKYRVAISDITPRFDKRCSQKPSRRVVTSTW